MMLIFFFSLFLSGYFPFECGSDRPPRGAEGNALEGGHQVVVDEELVRDFPKHLWYTQETSQVHTLEDCKSK